MSGHYLKTETANSGQSATEDWYLTPCGDGCVSVSVTDPASSGWPARLVNGQWTMDVVGTALCSDSSRVPNANNAHYTWDSYTLAGTVEVSNKFAVCGESAPRVLTNKIQLRQAPS
jgi:hypothetical protein